MKLQAGILDPTKRFMAPNVWVESPKQLPELDPELRSLIMATAYAETAKRGLTLKDILLYGGIATYQWSPGSDIDVSLYIDWQGTEDADKLIGEFKEIKVPYKGFEIHFFLKPPEEFEKFEVAEAVYDVIQNQWIIPPQKPQQLSFDKYAEYMKEAERLAKILDQKLGARERLQGMTKKLSDPNNENTEALRTWKLITDGQLATLNNELITYMKFLRRARRALHAEIRKRYSEDRSVLELRDSFIEVLWKYLDMAGILTRLDSIEA